MNPHGAGRVPCSLMENQALNITAFVRLIREHQSFGITTHVNPDGDALGSEVGLAERLLSIGKEVHVVNHSATPYNPRFLDAERPIIEQHDEKKHEQVVRGVDAILVLDVNDPVRTRSFAKYLAETSQHIAVIDHHLSPKPFASEYLLDTDASSTGEMILRL